MAKDDLLTSPLSSNAVLAEACSTPVANETVACRAYAFFIERGAEHGDDIEDWLRAERELRRRQQEATLPTHS